MSDDTRVRTSMRAAGPGSIRKSTGSITGRAPGTSATTLNGIFPTELATSIPVESIVPSPCSPRGTKRMLALLTGRPAASSARAVTRTESPAVTVRVRGVTSIRATGEAGACAGA
jgi:hypothetical protein